MAHQPVIRTLAWKIVLGILLIAVSVATLGFFEFDRERKHLEQNLLLTVTALSKAVDIELETVATGAAMLLASNRAAIERHDFAAFHDSLVKAMSETRLISHFAVVDPAGQQVLNTQRPYGAPLPLSRNQDKFAPVFKSGTPLISALAKGTISDRPEIFLVFPIRRQGETTHAFVAVVPANSLATLLSSLNIPPEWLGNIFDSDLNIVARTRDQDKFIGQKVAAGLQGEVARRRSGVFENLNLDNVHSIAAFHQSEGTGFGITIGVPKQLILRQALAAQLLPSLAVALAVSSLLVAWHFGVVLMHRRDTEERLRASLAKAAVGFAMTSLDGRFIEVNQAFCDLVGYSRDELRALAFPQLLRPDDLAENMALYRQLTAGEIPAFVIENRFVRKDGSLVWVRKSVSMVRGDNHVPRWSFALIEDVTDRRRAEAELADKNRALERSNADLEQFAYVASHDLQTPLRDVIHYTQLIERRYKDRLDSDGAEFIDFIVDGGKRMTRLIHDLLEFSRVSRHSEPLHPTPAGEAVTLALKNLGTDLAQGGVELMIADLPVVMAEQTHLVSLFQNLLGNGLKYRAPERKPVLSISAEPDALGRWRFAVADNGIGIAPEYHDKIFEIFQRLNPSAETKGTGIGLTLCRRIVNRFGGRIWVESTPGAGSTFFFTLADGSTAT
jgi:PAS domain S-box-containing protein